MALILANRINLHGNHQILDLQKQILNRFLKDIDQKNNSDTAVKRIFFGLNEDSEFDWTEKTGADWTYFQLRYENPLIFISGFPTIKKLQDYITICASKIDPNVVVQLDYEDSGGVLIGTRLTTYLDDSEVESFEEEEYTPEAESRELSRSNMKAIKRNQLDEVRYQLINELGEDFNRLKLVKSTYY
jgi:hypothetical protein